MNRRQFTVEAALALLGGALVTISGCDSSPTAPDYVDAVGNIQTNHGHSAVITAAQLAAGGELEISIQGTSRHTHKVSLSAMEMVMVRNGVALRKETSATSHFHVVTFNA
jgi:hypothetical protein